MVFTHIKIFIRIEVRFQAKYFYGGYWCMSVFMIYTMLTMLQPNIGNDEAQNASNIRDNEGLE